MIYRMMISWVFSCIHFIPFPKSTNLFFLEFIEVSHEIFGIIKTPSNHIIWVFPIMKNLCTLFRSKSFFITEYDIETLFMNKLSEVHIDDIAQVCPHFLGNNLRLFFYLRIESDAGSCCSHNVKDDNVYTKYIQYIL